MNTTGVARSDAHKRLSKIGIHDPGSIYWNAPTSILYEHAVRRQEGQIAHLGPIVVSTGRFTGRTPKDKFIVPQPSSKDKIWWDGNKEFPAEKFDALHARVAEYFKGRDVYVQDCHAGADETHRLPVRVVTEYAWHSLFVRNMFIQERAGGHFEGEPGFTVLSAPGFHSDPERDGTRSDAFIILNLDKRLIIIGGTEYAGEIKKSIFTVMHYLLPLTECCRCTAPRIWAPKVIRLSSSACRGRERRLCRPILTVS